MATRKNTRKGNWGKIINEGAGGFLNPPTHPEHTRGVTSVYGHTFYMSLSAAAESDWLDDDECRSRCRTILKNWKPLPIDHSDVQDWISQVLGYFKDCYVGQDKQGNLSWNASDLRIWRDADPILNADIHAGIHLIRQYYPEFNPTKEHFDKAYWGSKKEEVA